jgi:hypothetical protein
MADRDAPIEPGDDELDEDRVGEFFVQVEEELKKAAPETIANTISEIVLPGEVPQHAPQPEPPPTRPPVNVPEQPSPGRPWWAMPLAIVVGAAMVSITIVLTFGSGEGAGEGAAPSTGLTPSPTDASAPASEPPTTQESTSAAAPIEPTPEATSAPATTVLYEDQFVGLPRLTDDGESQVYVDLDVPQVLLVAPNDFRDIDFTYYADRWDDDDQGIYSANATIGDLGATEPNAETCTTATQVNPVSNPRQPESMYVDDVLCVITSEGNIAAMTLTDKGGTEYYWEVPAMDFNVTLWVQP